MNLGELSPDIQEKAKACRTPEESLELAKSKGYELSAKEIDSISAGVEVWCNYSGDCICAIRPKECPSNTCPNHTHRGWLRESPDAVTCCA